MGFDESIEDPWEREESEEEILEKERLEQEVDELKELINQLTKNHEEWEKDIEKIMADITVLKSIRNDQ